MMHVRPCGHRRLGTIGARALTILGILLATVLPASMSNLSARADEQRIVSIGGDVTEILYALQAQDRIVAVDSTSQFPADALKSKKVIGYMRALSAEGVLSIGGTMIIASAGAGPPEVVRSLKSSSTPYVEVADGSTPQAIADKVRTIAAAVGATDRGEALIKQVDDGFAQLATSVQSIKTPKPRVLFMLSVRDGRAVVGGQGTSAAAILEMAGAVNAANDVAGYKPVAPEGLVAMAPDIILVMRRESADVALGEARALAGLEATPAGANGRFMEVDGLSLLGFGPRTPQVAMELIGQFDKIAAMKAP